MTTCHGRKDASRAALSRLGGGGLRRNRSRPCTGLLSPHERQVSLQVHAPGHARQPPRTPHVSGKWRSTTAGAWHQVRPSLRSTRRSAELGKHIALKIDDGAQHQGDDHGASPVHLEESNLGDKSAYIDGQQYDGTEWRQPRHQHAAGAHQTKNLG